MEKSSQVFENPLLESLTRVSAVVAFPLYTLLQVAILMWAIFQFQFGITTTILCFLGGILFWTLFEYLAHRYIFHLEGESQRIKRFTYILHGVHHETPKDKTRLIMPLVPYLLISSALYGLAFLFFGKLAFVFMPGMLIGYVIYVAIHYAIHTQNPPHFLRYNLKHHALHHYKYDDKCFGVSSPIWDMIFGTMPPKKEN